MPFKSEAQRKYLWANEPGIAREWTDTYGSKIHKADGGIMRRRYFSGAYGQGAGDRGGDPHASRSENIAAGRAPERGPAHLSHNAPATAYTPPKTIREKVGEGIQKYRKKGIESYLDRNQFRQMQNLGLINNPSKWSIINNLVSGATGKVPEWAKGWSADELISLTGTGPYAGAKNAPTGKQLERGADRLRTIEDFRGTLNDPNLQTRFDETFPGPDIPEDSGGEEIPWWLRQQAPVGSTPIKEEVASNDLGGGHFLVPLKYVKGGVRAAEGGRIGFQRGGPPGGGDPGMRGTGRDYGSSYGPGRDTGWSPGVGGRQHIPTHRPAPRPDPEPTPDRFPGAGIRAINPYINPNRNLSVPNEDALWRANFGITKDDENDITRVADISFPKGKWDYPEYKFATEGALAPLPKLKEQFETEFGDKLSPEVEKQFFDKFGETINERARRSGGVSAATITTDEMRDAGLPVPDAPPTFWERLIGNEGGRIGYQQGNMVEGEIEGAEMEGAMMQSKEVIKELYDALIAQGLSPQEAMEKIKEMIAASQAEGPEAPMMGEEFPGQEFGRAPAAFGGIMDTYTGRRRYGLGSFFKKATRKLKKLASSKLGKIALGYIATAGLSNYMAGTGWGLGSPAQSWSKMEWLKPGKVLTNIGTTGTKAASFLSSPASKTVKDAKDAKDAFSYKDALLKWIIPGSLLAGATAEETDEIGGVEQEYNEKKADMDRYLANLDTYEGGDYRVPEKYRVAQGGRIGYKHGGMDWFPWPSYKGHSELEEEEYRGMSNKELEALLEKDEYDGLADYILTERLQKKIGGDYWPFLGINYQKKEGGANMIEKLRGYKYGENKVSMEDAITDLENKYDEAIEEGFDPGGTTRGFENLYIFDKEDIPKKVEKGWGHVKLEDDTGIATVAQGGRIGRQEGGLMNLGGMEKDYRNDGGFVPLGGEEKADDVPARLSRNEFVFTADAVRNAGGGDIDRGAEVMENVMKNLEAGGKVSEESQGEGAQGMFEVSERLSEVV